MNRAVCLNCMDGRIQMPVIQWVQEKYGYDYVDMITEPGMDGLLSNPQNDIEAVFKKMNISLETNKAKMIFVVGHHDCRGNHVSDDEHQTQICLSVERVRAKYNYKVAGLWVNSNWQVSEII